jgi:formamidopyrimidine-DNA glycosylase
VPELPDLEIIREFLAPRLAAVQIASAHVLRPLIVRNFYGDDVNARLAGRRISRVERRGKFLILTLDDGQFLVFHPMLAGRIRYGAPLAKNRTRDAFALHLADGKELRYNDQKDMGKIYVTGDLGQVPGFIELGPEADDPALTLEGFRERLKRHNGEIKGVLTNQAFVAGIGNAYADEILWCAQIYPFRRRANLSADEVERLYNCMRTVLSKAIETLRDRVGDKIDVEVRDFLAVHGREGEDCPRCGGRISEITYERISTHFCRACQPGLMVAKGRKL